MIITLNNTGTSLNYFNLSLLGKMMFEKKAESVNSPKSALPQTNQVQTQLQQQFTSHLSTASVETIVNSPTNKSPSETMTSSESKFDQDDQTPKIEGNVESTPAKEDSTPLDGEAENSLDSSSSSSGSDTDNVGKSTFKSGDLWSSGSSDDEAPKKVSLLQCDTLPIKIADSCVCSLLLFFFIAVTCWLRVAWFRRRECRRGLEGWRCTGDEESSLRSGIRRWHTLRQSYCQYIKENMSSLNSFVIFRRDTNIRIAKWTDLRTPGCIENFKWALAAVRASRKYEECDTLK